MACAPHGRRSKLRSKALPALVSARACVILLGSADVGGFVLPRDSTSKPFTPEVYHAQLTRVHSGRSRHRMRAVELGLVDMVNSWFISQPYQSSFVVASMKATVSDLLAQFQEPSDNFAKKDSGNSFGDICWQRLLAFFAYGGFWGGCANYFIFNECYPVWFGDGGGWQTVAVKVMFDQLVVSPLFCLPLAYIVKAIAFNTSIKDSLQLYINDARKDLLIKCWCVWLPAQCVNFTVVPPAWRVTFIAFVSFFWFFLLSSISYRKGNPEGAEEEQRVPVGANCASRS